MQSQKYTRESTLRYNRGADNEIMKTINRQDNSPETSELVERRRIELTKRGQIRYSWHKRLEREILLTRRPGDTDRREIKRIDKQLHGTEECRETHLCGGYFRDFGNEIPPRAASNTERNPDSIVKQSAADTESTTSSSPEEPVTTQEPGAYPASPVQEYRHGPKKLSFGYTVS